MKLLFGLMVVSPFFAQSFAQAPAASAPAPAPAGQAAPTPAAAAAPAESPVPSAENWLSGYIDLGYQWQPGVGGSYETYRSIVNLGAGPKLIDSDFTILDPKRRLFDRIRVRAYDWGDQPYESLHVFANKQGIYEFNADYRRLAYFNNLPSYADPLLGTGVALDEQSFDTRRTVGSFSLDLFRGRMLSPYLGYDRDSSSGQGVTAFETTDDSFAIPDTVRDSTNLYRGGIHIAKSRFHVTLEEGGTTFKNDQNTYTGSMSSNTGNSTAPVLGQTLDLTSMLQDYGIRGTSTYTKAILTANPFSWLDIYGTFLFSEPRSNVNYKQFDNGNFALLSEALFYTSEQDLVTATAKLPHTTGNLGWEIRPASRIRILQSWSTDRLHNAGSADQADTLLGGGVLSQQTLTALESTLATNYSQADTNIIGDVSRNVSVRAGYRYVWGDGNDAVYPAEGLLTVTHDHIRQQIGMGAVTWRAGQKFSLTGEAEIGSSGGAYFRTSLYDYRKVRALGRYRISNTIHVSGSYNLISNRNPTLDDNYKFLVHQESAQITWNPTGRKFDFEGSYEHCGYHSQIDYLVPETLTSTESIYEENCHTISGYFNGSYKGSRLSAGGSAVLTSGSRPTTYYQPTVKLSVPLRKNLGWFAEWRYYGFGETFYMYEAFRAHLIVTGLRFSR